ncbi:MAG: ABC transporter substrate-binding protein [Burkholderiales bacterium]|nr:ABC transporter substrate-binding protein [Burkholderiales bacterium]
MQVLDVGIVSRTYFYVPIWAARREGLFAAAGLEVRETMLGNASQIEPLASGRLDLVIGAPEGVLQDAAAGGPLRIIAGHTGRLSHFIVAQPRLRRIEDLRGATVGILSMTEGTFFHVRTLMAAHGLSYPGDYRVKETGGAPHRHQALLEGSIDMGLQSIPWVYLEEELGFSNLGDLARYVPEWQFNTINANAARARSRRAAVVAFLAALARATDWVYRHRDEASAIAAREMNLARAHAERAWDYYTGNAVLTRNLEVNPKGLAAVIESQRAAGLLPASAPGDPADYVAPEFLAASKNP